MILILFSKLTAAERHTIELLMQHSNLASQEVMALDLHSFSEHSHTLRMDGGGVVTFNDRSIEDFKHVICWNVPRCDALLRIQGSLNLPGLFRHQVTAFVEDFSFLLTHSNWVPGTISSIMRGHSKMRVFREALDVGLLIPQTTTYSKMPAEPDDGGWYKKSLGFPCMVSYDKTTTSERFVGNTNSMWDKSTEDGYYWQWQTPIKAKAQIRCQVIGERVWSALWEKEDTPFVDLRERVNKGNRPEWKQYKLPEETEKRLLALMRKLELSTASPEFFINGTDELIFFDLNPCGDFKGFFPPEVSKDMVKSIYDLCP